MNSFNLSKVLFTFVVFVAIDSAYLISMKGYFDEQIKQIQGSGIQMNLYAAILCYISLVFGLYYFIIKDKKPLYQAFLLGLVIYSVYEFTTWALLKNWKMQTVIIDSLWGSILFTLTTAIVYKVYL
jgi:uncharacterized membrane protein